MLSGYDAQAVATVMGVVFLQGPQPRAVPADPRQQSGHARREFVSASAALLQRAVEEGLPRVALRHVAEQVVGDDPARISAFEWGIVQKATLERRGRQLSPQESERTERVARLFVHARRALGSGAEARQFMTSQHPELDGRTPVESARTDLGARRTEQILLALEHGLAL